MPPFSFPSSDDDTQRSWSIDSDVTKPPQELGNHDDRAACLCKLTNLFAHGCDIVFEVATGWSFITACWGMRTPGNKASKRKNREKIVVDIWSAETTMNDYWRWLLRARNDQKRFHGYPVLTGRKTPIAHCELFCV